jgi:hypothetical protein
MDTILFFTCSTCGRDSAEPYVVYAEDGLRYGCVDRAHDGFTAAIEAHSPGYAAHKARARAAGLSGDVR